MGPRVYVIEDDPVFSTMVSAFLMRNDEFRVRTFADPEEALEAITAELPDVVLTDLRMPNMDGIEVCRRLRASWPLLPIFVITAHGHIESAIKALKAGANEYLLKPPNLDELETLMLRALEERPLREEAKSLNQERQARYSPGAILGNHPKTEETRAFVRQVADVPHATVLLLGESGTGKNLVAQTIHYSSAQAGKRFVEINCSALPPALLEAELFGYMRGAFTDARESKRGLVELADGGTLFLDEVGDLPPEVQAKLLSFLESRRFRRLGGTDEIEVKLRLITATNKDVTKLIGGGSFRADLYYRIGVATHTLAPLRDTREDIPILAEHFRSAFNREFRKQIATIMPAALEALEAWSWPGNVRELRNVIERAMIFASGPELTLGDLPPLGLGPIQTPGSATGDSRPRMADGLTLPEVEKEYIRRTLEQFDDNIQKTAESLGISRKNLWEKRKKHGLLE